MNVAQSGPIDPQDGPPGGVTQRKSGFHEPDGRGSSRDRDLRSLNFQRREPGKAGNLLGREVTADDVAGAFVALALAPATTGAIITVDGGNIAAALR